MCCPSAAVSSGISVKGAPQTEQNLLSWRKVFLHWLHTIILIILHFQMILGSNPAVKILAVTDHSIAAAVFHDAVLRQWLGQSLFGMFR
jgi:hypothetical protein